MDGKSTINSRKKQTVLWPDDKLVATMGPCLSYQPVADLTSGWVVGLDK